MHNYEHKKLIETIAKISQMPTDPQEFAEWIKAEKQLEFLRQNALANEIVLYGVGEGGFVHSMVVPNAKLSPVKQKDLMKWNIMPDSLIAVYGSGSDYVDMWIERSSGHMGAKSLKGAVELAFNRTFDGWSDARCNYYEVHQEYAHLNNIHWVPEEKSYCRYNQNGEIDSIVSVTTREDKDSELSLVSFKWEPLEEYLAASKASLVRIFDFTLFLPSEFGGWSNNKTQKIRKSNDFFYEQQIMPGHAAYTRGVQIIRPRRSEKAIFAGIKNRWYGQQNKQYVEFTAHDWRNDHVTKISTDPSATTNYFDAEADLPFEVSPAFFKPEVLSKYKADRDKYTVGERDIFCRAAWYLQSIDVNEAGQVHAYIRYLRRPPYTEQLYWLSYNEEPRGGGFPSVPSLMTLKAVSLCLYLHCKKFHRFSGAGTTTRLNGGSCAIKKCWGA